MGFCISGAAAPSDAVRGFPGQHGADGVVFRPAVFQLVLETAVRLLANPMFIRMAAVLLSAVAAFIVGIVAMRMLRRGIIGDGGVPAGAAADVALPLQAYTVIQQLKQQKFALQNEQKVERQRSKNSEHVTAAIISNLPCGMLLVTANGLVR